MHIQRPYDASAITCVMDSSALHMQCAICTVKSMKWFAAWQHRFDVDLNLLSYPAPLFLVQFQLKHNQFICCW